MSAVRIKGSNDWAAAPLSSLHDHQSLRLNDVCHQGASAKSSWRATDPAPQTYRDAFADCLLPLLSSVFVWHDKRGFAPTESLQNAPVCHTDSPHISSTSLSFSYRSVFCIFARPVSSTRRYSRRACRTALAPNRGL